MSTRFIGRRNAVGVGRETTRGTGVAATYWLNVLSFSHSDKVNKARALGTVGSIYGAGDKALVAQKWAEGAMECELGDKSFGLMLYALLGTCSSAVKETTAYNHTFSMEESNQHDSLSIHTTDPIGNLLFELSMIESLTITIVPDQLVKYTVEFKSIASTTSGAVKSYVSENMFLGRHTTLKIAANTGALAAAAKVKPKSVKLIFKKNLELDNALGTVQPQDILNRQMSISGEIQLAYEDRAYANYMLDGDYKALRIDILNNDVAIGGSSNPEFVIDFSKVDFDSWEPDLSNDDIAKQKINFEALYDLGGNGNVINSCVLTNTATSY